MKARQGGNDVPMLRVEVLESGIIPKDVHPLPLREYDPDRAILKHQPRLAFEEHTHLLVQTQLDKILRQPLI